jgi:type 1 glutamine amidotransferase
MRYVSFLAAVFLFSVVSPAGAADAPKRLLLVTHSGGFIHDSVAAAEKVLKDIGPQYGFEVTCFRFTGNPDGLEQYSKNFQKATGEPVTREQCGRINTETLSRFDAVLFFTTGDPVNKEELKELIAWVEKGGAFAATHCGTDTLYGSPEYGKLVGGYFDGHPWHQKVRLHIEDPKHPAANGFVEGGVITDEIYQFKAPYSRDRLHIILSIDNGSIDVSKGNRKDHDYAVSWCQQIEKGRSFYTSLGHRKEVWKDQRFQKHLFGGLKWATGQAEGDATPSGKLSK